MTPQLSPSTLWQFHNSVTIENRGIKTQQIVSALERLVLTQDLATKLTNIESVVRDKDLIVYGDVVEINGPLVLPGHSVRIFARVLASSPDSKNRPASIDVSGAAPTEAEKQKSAPAKLEAAKAGETATAIAGAHRDSEKPGGDGSHGAHGKPGDPGIRGVHAVLIDINCTEADPNLRLTLVARGGAGQAGQGGQPGQDGQDGGAGAPGVDGILGIGLQYGTKGGKGGDGGDGGAGGVGGSGGIGGDVAVCLGKNFRREMVTADVRGGAMGPAGESGHGGAKGSGGKSGTDYEFRGSGESGGAYFPKKMDDGAEGRSGHTPGPAVNPPNEARDGTFVCVDYEPDRMSRMALPAHCTMLMHRVRNGFLSADPVENPDAFRTTAELLAWVESLTSIWPATDHLAQIHSQCLSLVQRLRLGLTYYGHPRSYAPRASLSFYQKSIEKAVKNLESIENSAIAYRTALDQHQDAAAKLTDAILKTKDQIGDFESRRAEIKTQMKSLEGQLEAAHKKVLAQGKVVTEKLQKAQAEIQATEGLTVEKLVTVVASWTLPKEKGAMDVIKFGAGVLKDIKGIYDEEAEAVYKIHRMGELREGMKLGAAYQEGEGALTLADPNGYKLMATRKRLDEALKPLYGKLPGDEARAALDLLIDVSDQRNQLVLDYNGLSGQLVEIKSQIAEATQQRAGVEEALGKKSRPDLPEFTAWVSDLYDKASSSAIEQVYLASRAYSWWALKEFPIYARLGLKSASTVTAEILKQAEAGLLNDFQRVVEQRGSKPSEFPNEEARALNPAARGAVITIDRVNFPRAFQELCANKATTIELPPTLPYRIPVPLRPPQESGDMGALSRRAEVMIHKVRVYLRGAKAKNGRFSIDVTHGGINQVVRRDGAQFTFTSAPVHKTFEYTVEDDETTIKFDGNITDDSGKRDYAPLSPFGWWRIAVDEIATKSLDLTGLTAVEIEFHGDAHSFTE